MLPSHSRRTSPEKIHTSAPMASSSRRATIGDLPDELLLAIVGHFHTIPGFSHAEPYPDTARRHAEENRIRRNALVSLCKTSKRWHGIAKPILYSTFIARSSTPADVARTYHFLDLLATKPDLAKRLKFVQYVPDHLVGEPWNLDVDAVFGRNKDRYRPVFEAILGQAQDSELAGLETLTLTALLLIISLPLKLEQLAIAVEGGFSGNLWELLFLYEDGTPNLFHGLKDLALKDNIPSFNIINPRNRFLSLRRLQLDGPVCFTDLREQMSPLFPELKSLHFTDTDMTLPGVVDMVANCGSLEKLHCQWGGHVYHPVINFTPLIKELAAHRDSLEELVLDTRRMSISPNEHLDPLDSLADFAALRYLALETATLLGVPNGFFWLDADGAWWRDHNSDFGIVDHLPPSLERLDFWNHFPVYDDTLPFRSFAEDCRSITSLQKVELLNPNPRPCRLLVDAFAARGVTFVPNFKSEHQTTE
ncbi:hypothetical protein EJ04DRAFT_16429 [Polyplosphaeria fusca]|uniref:F-box domain-containing protein n=1 Tax=Polyplosphaeria fusca TaxID=682080 RepID=A0A9P4QU44_9PLEO|nr:hypothetical protein EJ04DRAFT_16429 [Polyplosphaeria fusca]